MPNISFIACQSIISIGNLAPVGRFSPAMPQFRRLRSASVHYPNSRRLLKHLYKAHKSYRTIDSIETCLASGDLIELMKLRISKNDKDQLQGTYCDTSNSKLPSRHSKIKSCICDPILKWGLWRLQRVLSYAYVYAVQNFSSILVLVSCLYEHPIKSYKQKRKQYLYRLLLRKAIFH